MRAMTAPGAVPHSAAVHADGLPVPRRYWAIAAIALAPVLHRAHLHPELLAAGVVAVLGGHAIGRRAFARLQERRFNAIVRAVIVCAGVASIAAGAAAL